MTDPSPPPATDLASLQAKYDASTQGEWFLAGENSYSVCVQKEDAAVPSKIFSTHAWSKARENCDFAASIHNAFPAMAAELTAARERIAGLERENAELKENIVNKIKQPGEWMNSLSAQMDMDFGRLHAELAELRAERDRLRKALQEIVEEFEPYECPESHNTVSDDMAEIARAALADPKPEGGA